MKTKQTLNLVGVAILFLLIGIAIGIIIERSRGGSTEQVPLSAPVATTVKVEVIPQACLSALVYADQSFELAYTGFDAANRALQGVIAKDVSAVDDATTNIMAVNDEMDGLGEKYATARQACQSLSK